MNDSVPVFEDENVEPVIAYITGYQVPSGQEKMPKENEQGQKAKDGSNGYKAGTALQSAI